jgi:hypothetical protein
LRAAPWPLSVSELVDLVDLPARPALHHVRRVVKRLVARGAIRSERITRTANTHTDGPAGLMTSYPVHVYALAQSQLGGA